MAAARRLVTPTSLLARETGNTVSEEAAISALYDFTTGRLQHPTDLAHAWDYVTTPAPRGPCAVCMFSSSRRPALRTFTHTHVLPSTCTCTIHT
jgi:hypothetical protein